MKNKLILAVLTLCSTFVFAQTVAKTGNIDASETWTSDNVYVCLLYTSPSPRD